MIYYFSYARTALFYGLKYYIENHNTKKEILIPNYICEDVLQPVIDLNLRYIYYDLNDALEPKWDQLKNKVNKNTGFIMMVHFFGKNQNISKYLDFSNKHNLILVEDNAHGYGGCYNNKNLGDFGNFSISSPRKFLDIETGGILKFNDKIDKFDINLKRHKNKNKNLIIDYLKKFKFNKIINTFRKRPKYEDINYFRGSSVKKEFIDLKSLRYIQDITITDIKNHRHERYKFWYEFAKNNNLSPVFKKFDKNLMPLCFPVYTDSRDESKKWFKWGWKKNIPIYSWPTLPLELSYQDTKVYKRWEKLICFPLKF